MLALTFEVHQGPATHIYQELADFYHLPGISMLVRSIDEEIDWSPCEAQTQVYFVDNLRGPNRRHVFEIRFRTSLDAHDLAACYLSVDQDRSVHGLFLQFPPRGNRGCSSRMIGWLKELTKRVRIDPDFEICGIGERESYRFIREHSLSAFVWHEGFARYLHVTDHPGEVRERKQGIL